MSVVRSFSLSLGLDSPKVFLFVFELIDIS